MTEASAVAQVEPADGRSVRAVMRLLRDELTLTPDRWARMLRMTALVTVVVIVSNALRVPNLALSAYMIFFFSKSDVVATVRTGIAGVVGLTLVLTLAFVVYSMTFGEPALRLLAMSCAIFAGFYLVRSSPPLGPLRLHPGWSRVRRGYADPIAGAGRSPVPASARASTRRQERLCAGASPGRGRGGLSRCQRRAARGWARFAGRLDDLGARAGGPGRSARGCARGGPAASVLRERHRFVPAGVARFAFRSEQSKARCRSGEGGTAEPDRSRPVRAQGDARLDGGVHPVHEPRLVGHPHGDAHLLPGRPGQRRCDDPQAHAADRRRPHRRGPRHRIDRLRTAPARDGGRPCAPRGGGDAVRSVDRDGARNDLLRGLADRFQIGRASC